MKPLLMIVLMFFSLCDSGASTPAFAHGLVFTQAELESVVAEPVEIFDLYYSKVQQVKLIMGPSFNQVNENGWKVIFATLVSYYLKPYGSSQAQTLEELLAEDVLDCDNYLALTCYLTELLQPTEEFHINLVGWKNGYIGNHAQGFTLGTGVPLLVDPTVAFFAITDFNSLAKGTPVSFSKMFSFHAGRPKLNWMYNNVVNGVRYGYYKPVDLMYYFKGIDDYLMKSNNSMGWATPQSPQWE